MSSPSSKLAGRVTLDQLLALNDEIAALSRAGIPLDKGLEALGQDVPGQVGQLANRLADRLRSGANLEDVLRRDELGFPPVWRSVVLAGIRAGHLPAALEGLSHTIRRASEVRRSIAASMIYPLIVVAIAFVFLIFSLTTVVPVLVQSYQELVSRRDPALEQLADVARNVHVWAPWVPVALIALLLFWWYRSGRTLRVLSGGQRNGGTRYLFGRRGSRRLFSVAEALRDGRMATFADLLRLMHMHRVPLPEALVLAADASGDRTLSNGAREIANRLEAGTVLRTRNDLPAGFPPLLGWSLMTGAGQEGIGRALAASAEMYRQRSEQTVQRSTTYLPIVLTAVIGGGAVLLHSLLIFLPFTRMLYQLGLPQ